MGRLICSGMMSPGLLSEPIPVKYFIVQISVKGRVEPGTSLHVSEFLRCWFKAVNWTPLETTKPRHPLSQGKDPFLHFCVFNIKAQQHVR